MAATGRGFQDTGSTAKAFDGEEVDWYVCNVASYHVKQSMDPSVPLVENEDLRRWILLEDVAVARAAAGATGVAELELLVAQYTAGEECFDAAKVTQAMGMLSASIADRLKHGRAALDLLQQVMSATTQAQQLELDVRSSLGFSMDRKSGERKRNAGRIGELMKDNSSLRVDPLGLLLTSVLPRLYALCGQYPAFWDAGQVATEETAQEGVELNIRQGVPLCTKAAEESIGARKEYIRLVFELGMCGFAMPVRSTDEAVVEVQQRCQEVKWGRDGSIATAACMAYRFERHFDISQGLATGYDAFMQHPLAQYVAEYCGDVQQMIQIFEKQLGAMQSFAKRGVPGLEIGMYWCYAAPSFAGLELQVLHPFGTVVAALFGSFTGRCTDPSGCEEWYGSSDWSAWTVKHPGATSKDGLHSYYLKPILVFHLQAILSLSLASMKNSDFDLSWLDNLSSADDPKLHDCMVGAVRFTNTRVMIAEVLEWQGRHEEAVRCVSYFLCTPQPHACIHRHIYNV
jgi:hypothetical protein